MNRRNESVIFGKIRQYLSGGDRYRSARELLIVFAPRRAVSSALVDRACGLARDLGAALEIRLAGDGNGLSRRREWIDAGARLLDQPGCAPGERLILAFDAAFRSGRERVVAIDTGDGANLSPIACDRVADCFVRLGRNDAVIGPAGDGDYDLVGLARPIPELFTAMPYGSDGLLAATLAAARRLGVSFDLLAPPDPADWSRAIDPLTPARDNELPHSGEQAA